MKSSAPTAIALTLIMFLLVLAAAVFFLFQGQQTLKTDIQNERNEVRSLEKQLGETELNNSAAQATLDTLEVSSTSSAAENLELTEQLANSDQISATREANADQLTSELGDAEATVQSFESQAPLLSIVEPAADDFVTVGQPVDLVVVASDFVGVESISFNIDGELEEVTLEEPGAMVTKRHPWTPTDEGPVTIIISATNVNGVTSEPHTLMLAVVLPPTSTPEPTPEPTPELTPEPTAEN